MSEISIASKIAHKMLSSEFQPRLIQVHPADMARLKAEFNSTHRTSVKIETTALNRDQVRFRGVRVVKDADVEEGSPVIVQNKKAPRGGMSAFIGIANNVNLVTEAYKDWTDNKRNKPETSTAAKRGK